MHGGLPMHAGRTKLHRRGGYVPRFPWAACLPPTFALTWSAGRLAAARYNRHPLLQPACRVCRRSPWTRAATPTTSARRGRVRRKISALPWTAAA